MGRRAAAFGTETGSWEVWAWPLKLLYSFDLAFKKPAVVTVLEVEAVRPT